MQAEPVIRDRLSRGEIQARAEQLWRWLYPGKQLPRVYPVDRMIRELGRRNVVRLETGKDLPVRNGQQCYGEFTVMPRKRILIHKSLTSGEPRFDATLAHEIGHLVMHRKYLSPTTYVSTLKPPVSEATGDRFGRFECFSDLDWVEWQANEFMLCLLLPREWLIWLIARKQAALGIPVGPIYIDEQSCNQVAAAEIIVGISIDTMIQKPLVEGRMRFMGLIRDVRRREKPKTIADWANKFLAS